MSDGLRATAPGAAALAAQPVDGAVSAPGDPNEPTAPRPPRRRIRAGRNLPAAIAVGAILGAFILVPLFTLKVGFVGVVGLAVAIGTFEVVRALRLAGLRTPLVPLVAGAVAMPVVAYFYGPGALIGALAVTLLMALGVRAVGEPAGLLPDLAGTIFAAVYVGFTAGFAALLTAPDDGDWRVVAFLGTVVASDIGGYTAGVLSGGRHKLAPTVSPGKSWEGFAGSALACVVVASVVMRFALGGSAWQGVVLGLAVVCTATVGDLGESLLKRDIGIKDMGNLLPGHGGIMDRLDSLLCTAPVAWLLITAFLPPT
ncbi:phosphatidate cytidylyltransferase [Pseudofrankia sp. DC12]|uniref:phosphatidate cytidylyltransferase n=1 Tax=Pseudofrankia sp. DC12 TaxID=683315 RepID=UPI000A0086F3|nr:phosphatidate cytidylyltransferase [Pseudofrankia sp. DC12]